MRKNVDFAEFARSFSLAGRGESFSYAGLEVLFKYLTELEKDSGEESTLDPILFCLSFAEVDNEHLSDVYPFDLDEDDDLVEVAEAYLIRQGIFVGKTPHSLLYAVR